MVERDGRTYLTELPADFSDHHIEGYARVVYEQGGGDSAAHFAAPLISHIDGNLWMGGVKFRHLRLPADFKYVISLYDYERYRLDPNTKRWFVDMRDAGALPDLDDLGTAVDKVVECVKDGKTLVHCQAGLNRSGLVSALALVKLSKTPREAVDLLRKKRSPLVLCNNVFANYVLRGEIP